MTKSELLSIRAKKKQLERVMRKLIKLQDEENIDVVKDYRHSKKGIPIVIRGYNIAEVQKLRSMYIAQSAELLRSIVEIETWINNIPNVWLQVIASMRYIDGMKRIEIAEECHYSEATIKLRLAEIDSLLE